MVMNDIKHKQEILTILKRRLHVLELQAAKKGLNTEPNIKIEIEDIQEQIQILEQEIHSPYSSLDTNALKKSNPYLRQNLQRIIHARPV